MDAYGHVNNARFLTLYEEARVALFFTGAREMGLTSFEDGIVISRHEVDYLRPVDYGDPVRIEMWVEEIRASRFTIAYELLDGDVVASRARSVCVPFNLPSSDPRRLSDAEREFLGDWVLTKDDGHNDRGSDRRGLGRADAGAFLVRLLRLDPGAVVRLRPAGSSRSPGRRRAVGHAALRCAGRAARWPRPGLKAGDVTVERGRPASVPVESDDAAAPPRRGLALAAAVLAAAGRWRRSRRPRSPGWRAAASQTLREASAHGPRRPARWASG